MRKTSALTVLLVAALCFAALPALAEQHPPVPGPDFAGCPEDAQKFKGFPRFDITKDQDPVKFLDPGQYDFCKMMDNIYCSLALVVSLSADIANFANLVQCISMDINGPLNLDLKIPVQPNGVLDRYELAVLAYVLNTPSLPYYEEVKTAWEENFWELKELIVAALKAANLKSDGVQDKDITAIVNMLAPALTPSLTGVIAGFATLGDEMTNIALGELLGLLEDIGLEPPEGGIAAITTGIPALGPHGDVDGDGYTNMEEYLYFVDQEGVSLDSYLAAVFDPNQTPPSYDPVVTLSRKTGFIQIGDNITLDAKLKFYYDLPNFVRWYKDGVLIDGATSLQFELLNAQASDSGVYQVVVGITVEDGGKAETEISATTVLNVSDSPLPVAGIAGIGALAGALTLVAARRFRRK